MKKKNIFEKNLNLLTQSPDSQELVYMKTQERRVWVMDCKISPDVLNDTNITRFDAYAKKACKNALYKSYKNINRDEYPALFDDVSEQIPYIEKGFFDVETTAVNIMGENLNLNSDLAEALNNLPEILCIILILNIVRSVPIREIADVFGISTSSVNRYKKQALEKIRKELAEYEE